MFSHHTVDQECRHSFFNIMADRRDLRQRGIALNENCFSSLGAGRRCHVLLRTAQRWAHKFKKYGKFQRLYSTGHPCCSTREEDEAICRVHEENPFCSANQKRALTIFPGTSQTVMNRLIDANIHCQRAASKEGLTEGQAIDCLAFATVQRNFDWGSKIFTDETSISSDCELHGHVYHEPGTRFDKHYIQRLERSGQLSISCWCWLTWAGIGMLEYPWPI